MAFSREIIEKYRADPVLWPKIQFIAKGADNSDVMRTLTPFERTISKVCKEMVKRAALYDTSQESMKKIYGLSRPRFPFSDAKDLKPYKFHNK